VGVDLSQVFGIFCCVLDTFSTEAGKKMSERITTMSGKMKECFLLYDIFFAMSLRASLPY